MTKHDVLSQVWQFVYYVEERMAMPRLFDKQVMLDKLAQVKEVLQQADGTSSESDMHQKSKSRSQASSTNKAVAGKAKRRTR